MVDFTREHIRELADQAQAECESGVVAGNVYEQRYLQGVHEALRWAAQDSTSSGMQGLAKRAYQARELDCALCERPAAVGSMRTVSVKGIVPRGALICPDCMQAFARAAQDDILSGLPE